MATATIRINGVAGSKTDLALYDTVTLTNETSATTYNWYLLSQPSGTPVAVLSNPTSATATFTVPKEGSYLVKLVVNAGIAGEDTDQVVAAVRELETGDRIPAAGETTEVSPTEGWANDALNDILHRVTRLGSNGMISGVADAYLQAGDVVYVKSFLGFGLDSPQRRLVPKFAKALATTQSHLNGALGVMAQKVGGGGSVVSGERLEVQMFGMMQFFPNLGGSGIADTGTKVYVSDTGTLSLTPGTIPRPVGNVVEWTGMTTYSVFLSALDGGGASSSAPTGPAGGVLYGSYPNPTGLAADSSNYIKTQAYTLGGNVIISTPSNIGPTKGSDLLLRPGSSSGSGAGGAFDVTSGDSATGTSGSISWTIPDAPQAGSMSVYVGATLGSGTGGAISLAAGESAGGAGGAVTITAGASQGGIAGAINITAGNGLVAGALGGGGAVEVAGGPSNTTGLTPASRPFGTVTIKGGYNSNASGVGGSIVLRGGEANIQPVTETYAKLSIGGMDRRAGSLKAGDVFLTAGSASSGDPAATKGGDITIRGGDTLDATKDNCGRVIIKGGSGGVAGSSATGSVDIDAKTAGFVRIAKTNACIVDIGNIDASVFTRYAGAQILQSRDYTPTSGTTIPNNAPTWRLILSSSIAMTASPTVQAGDAVNGRGHRIVLINMSPLYSITFNTHGHSGVNSFLKLGANQRVLQQFGILELQYEQLNGSTEGYWLEIVYRGSAV